MSSPCFPCDVCIESFFLLNIPMTQGTIVAEADPCHQRRYKQDHIGRETRVAGQVRNYAHSNSRMTPAVLRKVSMPPSRATPATMGFCFLPTGGQFGAVDRRFSLYTRNSTHASTGRRGPQARSSATGPPSCRPADAGPGSYRELG